MNKTFFGFGAAAVAVLLALVLFASSAPTVASTQVANVDEAKVIMYGTQSCHYCKKLKKYLSKQNIPFYEYDIEKSSKAMAEFRKMNGRGTPLVIVNNNILYGYQPDRILELL